MCLMIVCSFPCQNDVFVAALYKLPVFIFLLVIRVHTFGGLPKLNSSLVNKVMLCVSQPETAVCDDRRILLKTYSYDHLSH